MLRVMNWHTCPCYLNDIVVFSSTFEQYLQRLSEVLSTIAKSGLQLNTKNLTFLLEILKCLVSKDGVHPDPDRVMPVSEFAHHSNPKQLRRDLGLAFYFRSFIHDFAGIAAPLNDLLKESAGFKWSDECERSFLSLRASLTSNPVLRH